MREEGLIIPGPVEATAGARADGGFKITYVSDHYGRGGQHTNGPDYGVYRCEHELTRTAVEVHSYQTHGAHKARALALTLCQLAVGEIER